MYGLIFQMRLKMWESELSNITLIDVINTSDVSVRLSNCMEIAMDDDRVLIKTVADYQRAGEKAMHFIRCRVPNMGLKSAKELDDLILNIIDAGGINKLGIEKIDKPYGISVDVALLSICEIVESNITSERLRNSIRIAKSHGGLPLETIGDYVKTGSQALRTMQELPNLGKKTAIELDDLIKVILANTNTDISEEGDGEGIPFMEANELEIEISGAVERILEKFHRNLNEREYDVLKYRAIDNRTLEEIGKIYSVTRERIRQIEAKVISKLLRIYGEVFNRIASEIDEILDESYGEVGLLDAASTLNLTPDILKLLIYICADLCAKHVRVRHEYILRSSTESNYSEWNETIDEVLYSLEWPICLSETYDGMPDIPQSYVERYLVKRRGAIIQSDAIVELRRVPQTARMAYVLRDAGHPLHSAEIARRYNSMFGEEIKEHNTRAILGRMEEALIVDRGVYSLYETLNISENIITEIRRHSYNYIRKEEKYVSSKVLYRELFKNKEDFQNIDNAYVIHGILQDDARFIIRRGLMIGIKEHMGLVEFKPLTEEVHESAEAKGPCSVSQIKTAISDRRNVLSVGITKILEDSDKIIKITPGIYDTVINVFGEEDLYQHMKLAIRIALFDHVHGLFELTSNLRLLEVFNAIDITKSMVTSILDMMDDVARKKQNYSIDSDNKKIETYNTIINSVDKDESTIDVKEEVEKIFGTELAHKYIAADYRMQTHGHDISSGNKGIIGGNSEIGSILSAFEI